jgi:endonuclease/exonuclease/phosphatase family metal-dependent hydrolase
MRVGILNIAQTEMDSQKRKAIRVATYNIAGNHPTFSFEKILKVLVKINADVICLQEVSQINESLIPSFSPPSYTQAHYIADRLKMNCIFGCAVKKQATGVYGIAILSRFPLHSVRHIPLPTGSYFKDDGSRMPGQNELRLGLSAIVSPNQRKERQEFQIICTHFGIYNTAEKSTRGFEPINLIHKFISSEDRKEMPSILAGDLNATFESPILLELAKDWECGPSKGKTTKNKEIDFILYRGYFQYCLQNCHTMSFEETDWASDHLPVIAEWIQIAKS